MKFNSKHELGRYLFDQTVEPHHTGTQRMRLVICAAAAAEGLWAKYADGGEQ